MQEFWTDLSALAFNMDFGLFRTTPVGAALPESCCSVGSDNPAELFAFAVTRKALYEGGSIL